jgi:hypothetical protein
MVRANSSSRPANNNFRPANNNSSSNKPAVAVSKTPTPTPTPTPTVQTKPDNKGKLSPGAIAGIVIGSIAFVLIISFIIYKIKNR